MNTNKVDGYIKKAFMELGAIKARDTMTKNYGGPFGAVVVKDNTVISIASNSVLADNDPTAHAEVNAIRSACKTLGTYDLSGCELYATGFPCPMCMAAIIWANIKKVYVSGLPKDAERIGFRDDFIYDFIQKDCTDIQVVEIEEIDRDIALKLYKEYEDNNKTIY